MLTVGVVLGIVLSVIGVLLALMSLGYMGNVDKRVKTLETIEQGRTFTARRLSRATARHGSSGKDVADYSGPDGEQRG